MLKATLEVGPARPSQDANHESRPRRPRRELLGDDDLNTFLLQDTSKGLEIYVGCSRNKTRFYSSIHGLVVPKYLPVQK
jgi:hypothetical protein